jgi:hypothetical protein
MKTSVARMTPLPPTVFSPQASHGNGANVSNPRLTDRLARWAHNPSTVCGTHATMSIAARGNTVVTPRGQGRKHPEVACTMCNPSGHRSIASGTPPRGCAVLPRSTLPAMSRPNFAQPPTVGGGATPRSDKEVSSDVTIQDVEDGANGSRKGCKQCLHVVTSMTNDDGGGGGRVGAGRSRP